MKAKLSIVASALGLAVVALSGCTSGSAEHRAVRADPMPEMFSQDKRAVDRDNVTASTWHLDRRMMWDDISRFWLADRPSRLTKLPRTR